MRRVDVCEDCEYMLASLISNWTEVSDEEYVALRQGIDNQKYNSALQYVVIEEPGQGQGEVIREMINVGMEIIRKQEEQRAAYARKEAERKAKLLTRTKKSKEDQLAKLAKELGVKVVKDK